jgi:hypothetical protein
VISRFDTAFSLLYSEFRSRKIKSFFRDLRGVLEEDEDIMDILRTPTRHNRLVCVSADRRKNDAAWSYPDFDKVLILLDAICGGNGIRKPVNQLRVLQWNASRKNLAKVLRYLAKSFSSIDFKSALVLPYPDPATGIRIVRRIYKR